MFIASIGGCLHSGSLGLSSYLSLKYVFHFSCIRDKLADPLSHICIFFLKAFGLRRRRRSGSCDQGVNFFFVLCRLSRQSVCLIYWALSKAKAQAMLGSPLLKRYLQLTCLFFFFFFSHSLLPLDDPIEARC